MNDGGIAVLSRSRVAMAAGTVICLLIVVLFTGRCAICARTQHPTRV